MDIANYFISLVALVPLVVLITDFLVRWLKIQKSAVKQVLSWVISIALCLAGMWLNLGMFASFSVGVTLAYGLATGLVANGIFDINLVQMLLDIILKFLPKKPV